MYLTCNCSRSVSVKCNNFMQMYPPWKASVMILLQNNLPTFVEPLSLYSPLLVPWTFQISMHFH
jgi:hypothetical protein